MSQIIFNGQICVLFIYLSLLLKIKNVKKGMNKKTFLIKEKLLSLGGLRRNTLVKFMKLFLFLLIFFLIYILL